MSWGPPPVIRRLPRQATWCAVAVGDTDRMTLAATELRAHPCGAVHHGMRCTRGAGHGETRDGLRWRTRPGHPHVHADTAGRVLAVWHTPPSEEPAVTVTAWTCPGCGAHLTATGRVDDVRTAVGACQHAHAVKHRARTGEWAPAPPPPTGAHRLTPTQAAVLALIVRGLPDQAIAERMGVSLSAVRQAAQDAVIALGATGRAHAAALAVSGRGCITVRDNRRKDTAA